MVCYAEKEEKPFWFSSLGQMIQFGTIKFCRTLRKSHYNSRVSRHEAPIKKQPKKTERALTKLTQKTDN